MPLNGALTLGTLDGANVEILENVGEDNIFIFGNTVEQVEQLRREGYRSFEYYQNDAQLRTVVDQIIEVNSHPKILNVIINYYKACNTTIIIKLLLISVVM